MYADPAVVRRKVDRELTGYFARQDHYRARGIWVLQYDFPQVLVAFVAPACKPYPIAPYGALFDLSNYDVEPPSIRFVNPFTREPLKRSEIATDLARFRVSPLPQHVVGQDAQDGQIVPQMSGATRDLLLQATSGDDEHSFVCLQGVREYHDNPAHTGDPWWLYRSKGAGSLLRLLDLLSRYGTEAIRGLQYNIQMQPAGVQIEFSLEQP
jgi:hypothetical protein